MSSKQLMRARYCRLLAIVKETHRCIECDLRYGWDMLVSHVHIQCSHLSRLAAN